MAIVLDHLNKCFGSHCVVNNVSLEVRDGELFVLLGPSGSGKSTVLRMIAGLLEIDAGRILLHGSDVTGVSPQRRGVGFVFQHYALFRHLTVAANIEFALRIRKTPAAERRRRRDELLELVGLVGLEKRLPHQLSGGQQQRVALARALAHQPSVLLLDEPFGALDAKIRAELRRFLRRIQSELGVTTIFVTHDQEEGFELADRMGVMNYGRLLEVGPPMELYLRPQTEFVATFLGRANLMVGECTPSGVKLGPVVLPFDGQVTAGGGERRVQVLFRPEDVAVKDSPDALRWPLLGRALVDEAGFSGSIQKIRLRLPPLQRVRPISPAVPFGADYILVEATRSQHQARQFPLAAGDQAWVGVRRTHALLHPGLSFLAVTDGSPEGAAAVELAGSIGRLAHARLTLLGLDPDEPRMHAHLEQLRERIGGGPAAVDLRSSPDDLSETLARETTRQPYDLVLHALPAEGATAAAERLLESQEHHLLLAPSPPRPVPQRVLISVAAGEAGKYDVLFAGRLIRHLGAAATVLSVAPEESSEQWLEQGRRFLAGAARTLSLLGVPERTQLRRGRIGDEIRRELSEGGYDMIVVGAPLPDRSRRISLEGVVGGLLADLRDLPVLIVRADLGALEPDRPPAGARAGENTGASKTLAGSVPPDARRRKP
ncbi:MAG: ATP-binding cassette domain-containing protein [Candidatus Eisenbacteria bacterium]|uniref:ATP-binding cassette domain-containing protein n=1 Tax=Eiseniibacteriota bacterium TaxID=2212470 RepID=A0A937XBL1_UNCEI|nr:ATP-binding cassette domain-containing protein [Candidatus Eisenbacteria bacterium]